MVREISIHNYNETSSGMFYSMDIGSTQAKFLFSWT